MNIDNEFGNIFIRFVGREPMRSEEGVAFVTIGIDGEGRIAYISIEPEDRDLREFIRRVRTT
ncbi:hypothetical protein [Vulcanisaeta thermophila]|uniref:hypothetical protein n=1 Tax=Vulcanisaeta thermophila TaxID=867917 RepID=UPI00192E4C30|nr:hypothetical protein [Vulcanisaeta thermophila]